MSAAVDYLAGLDVAPGAPPDLTPEERQIKALWTALQVAERQQEKKGLQFGQVVYEFRAKSEVVSGGTTFRSTLDKLGIPHATAYRWIARYEETIGERRKEISGPKIARRCATPDCLNQRQSGNPYCVDCQPTLPGMEPDAPEPATITSEDRDRASLDWFAKRLESIDRAVQQIVEAPRKWLLQHDQLAEVRARAATLKASLEELESILSQPENSEESRQTPAEDGKHDLERPEDAPSRLAQAKTWLRELLRDGPVAVPTYYKQPELRAIATRSGLPEGVGRKTINRALSDLHIEERDGCWCLPSAALRNDGHLLPQAGEA